VKLQFNNTTLNKFAKPWDSSEPFTIYW